MSSNCIMKRTDKEPAYNIEVNPEVDKNLATNISNTTSDQNQAISLYQYLNRESWTTWGDIETTAAQSFPFLQPPCGIPAIAQLPTFNIVEALQKLTARHGKPTGLEAVHMAQPFVVTDAWQPDMPVVYVSDSFLVLTGYDRNEVLGRNCRFLQAPGPGAPRSPINNAAAFEIKQKIALQQEFQHTILNFTKDGRGFVNSLTIIPIPSDNSKPRYMFGFSSEVARDCDFYAVEQLSMQFMANPQSQIFSSSPNTLSAGTQPECLASTSEPGGVQNTYYPKAFSETSMQPSYETLYSNEIIQENAQSEIPIESDSDSVVLGLPADDFDISLLENIDGLVLIIFPHGTIFYISPWCRNLGYNEKDLCKTAIEEICHPLDAPNLLRQLKKTSTGQLSAHVRIKRLGGYSWFHFQGSTCKHGVRKLMTLVGLPQSNLSLDRHILTQAGELSSKDIWLKLSISGLVLSGFGTSRTVVGLSAEALIGTTFFNLICDAQCRQRSRQMLQSLKENEGATMVSCLVGSQGSARGHRFQAKVVFYAGKGDVHHQPHFALVQIKFIKNVPRTQTKPTDIIKVRAVTPGQNTADDLFGDLDPSRCGVWQSDLHNLRTENNRLQVELEMLIQRQTQRRRTKKRGFSTVDCANCHTKATPEWRKGPDGKRNLCNACGLRWAKMTREREKLQANRPEELSRCLA